MSRITIIIIILVFAVSVLSAEEKQILSGTLTGRLPAGNYLVKSTVTVPAGEELYIAAGSALYFEQFTSLEVLGFLSVDGLPAAPVIFTSVNDTAGSPEPAQAFDWNGIKAESPAASILLRHARVSNSVYGVNLSYPGSRAEFIEAVFENNGYASLAKGERVVPIPVGEPFSARWNTEEEARVPELPPVSVAARESVKNEGGGRARLIVNISAITVGAAGVAISGVSLARLDGNFDRYVTDGGSGGRGREQTDKIRSNITMSTVGAAMAGAALACLGVTLFF